MKPDEMGCKTHSWFEPCSVRLFKAHTRTQGILFLCSGGARVILRALNPACGMGVKFIMGLVWVLMGGSSLSVFLAEWVQRYGFNESMNGMLAVDGVGPADASLGGDARFSGNGVVELSSSDSRILFPDGQFSGLNQLTLELWLMVAADSPIESSIRRFLQGDSLPSTVRVCLRFFNG